LVISFKQLGDVRVGRDDTAPGLTGDRAAVR
jgi:hypothetical protein